MTGKLTDKQQAVLNYITESLDGRGIPPTLREIRDNFGYSSLSSPRHHLKELAAKGYINLINSVSRGIELLKKSAGIPILGRISAGHPAEAIQSPEGYLNLADTFVGDSTLFCLKVHGDSMKGVGIMEDDLVIVKYQTTAEDGDIVVAMESDEALVKRFLRKGDKAILHAENPDYPDIVMQDGSIAGKVVGVVRKYGYNPVY
ncbi:MAG: transcriptional repressor LexA [Elusimicrobia bacterium]|jgi:repressor LexA|nr:transcriptional repressor LexA [Elusimicrobiota bacterium]